MAPAFLFVDPFGFKVPAKLLAALMAADVLNYSSM